MKTVFNCSYLFVQLILSIKSVTCGSRKKKSTITRCPLHRGFWVFFTGTKFCEFYVFGTIMRKLVPSKVNALRGCLQEISFRVKWNIFILVSGQFFITAYMIQAKMKLNSGVISLQSFWKKRTSFPVTRHHLNTSQNETIWKETSAYP